MTENTEPDPALRGAGLSATGHTADELRPGERRAGTTYDDPGGPGTAYLETVSGDPDADTGQSPEGEPGDHADADEEGSGGSGT